MRKALYKDKFKTQTTMASLLNLQNAKLETV